eukprot:1616074-Prymnesium_polylepis.1
MVKERWRRAPSSGVAHPMWSRVREDYAQQSLAERVAACGPDRAVSLSVSTFCPLRYNQQSDAPISMETLLVVQVDGAVVEQTAPAWRFTTGKAVHVVIRADEGANTESVSPSSSGRGALSRLRTKRFHVGQFHVSLYAIEAKTTLNEKMLETSLRAALIDPFLET